MKAVQMRLCRDTVEWVNRFGPGIPVCQSQTDKHVWISNLEIVSLCWDEDRVIMTVRVHEKECEPSKTYWQFTIVLRQTGTVTIVPWWLLCPQSPCSSLLPLGAALQGRPLFYIFKPYAIIEYNFVIYKNKAIRTNNKVEEKYPWAGTSRLSSGRGCRNKRREAMTTMLLTVLAFACGWLLAKHDPRFFQKLLSKLEELFEKIKS